MPLAGSSPPARALVIPLRLRCSVRYGRAPWDCGRRDGWLSLEPWRRFRGACRTPAYGRGLHRRNIAAQGEDQHRQAPSPAGRSEEHTSELQSLMRISYAVFSLKKKTQQKEHTIRERTTYINE